MQPLDLIKSAEVLLSHSKGKPSQVNLRRATSSTYYALFHCLAKQCADLFVGGAGAAKSSHAWRQAYRALDHGFAKSACLDAKIMAQFPKAIEDFGNAFVTMQEKRHSADYDPFAKFTKSAVQTDMALARQVIAGLLAEPSKDRRAFAAHVLLKRRP